MQSRTASALLLGATIGILWIGLDPVAAAELGRPEEWQLGFQLSGTPVMDNVRVFHDRIMMPLITAIVLFVLALLVIVIVRFNAKANPTPSKTTHNSLIEVVWTVVPVLILVIIAIPSFRLLYFERTIPDADMTVKATGNQWYWSYEYPDQEGLSFDSLLLDGDALKQRQETEPDTPRLLAVDNPIVVPLNATVRLIVTGSDVIHSWAIPSFGTKIDAIPGRLNEAWFKAEKEGTYYGQCSELCGQGHAYMPIEVRVVSQEQYDAWVRQSVAGDVTQANSTLLASLAAAKSRRVAQSATSAQ
ncbi:cytochrome c oxidase subunit 2 [Rhodoligotrophos appendicifer]|uniref:cytochrome c oxidase subunit II n=1 Tax=Rhodoligotrophos appendicifer TaxID=987056 RepID=UPI0011871A33|nr:cytochrome c oxidase subunit II [Rhodoligotrophos appendicifer]